MVKYVLILCTALTLAGCTGKDITTKKMEKNIEDTEKMFGYYNQYKEIREKADNF